MLEFTDADTGKKQYVMVSRIVRIYPEKPGYRASSIIALDTGESLEAYETAEKLKDRVAALLLASKMESSQGN